MTRFVIATLLTVSLGAVAQAKDVPMNNAAIANHFGGKQFNIGGGMASFGHDKSYNFAGLFRGKWRATNRSLCVTFDTGAARCDKVVRDGKDVILIDASGGRTLVR